MEQINGRTMEVLRILGLAEKLRNTEGVPKADAPWTVLHDTGLGDPVPEFARMVYLSLLETVQLVSQFLRMRIHRWKKSGSLTSNRMMEQEPQSTIKDVFSTSPKLFLRLKSLRMRM
jgi:hypothetical protein